MTTKNKSLTIFRLILLGLIFLFGIVFFKFFNLVQDVSFRVHNVALLILYAGLIMALLSCRQQQKPSSRIIAVYLNLALAFYLMILFFDFAQLSSLTLAFVHIMTALFLDFYPVKVLFAKELVRKRKVLVVDDDLGTQKMIRPVLESHGMEVVAAITGEEGLKLASIEKPDLIILDVILPGIKGREVCQKLKQDRITRNIPVLFLTFKDSPDDIQAELKVGAIGHLSKPIHPQILIAELNKVIK